MKDKRLQHIYGMHYDYNEELTAHAVYHCQVAWMAGYVEHINAAHDRTRTSAAATNFEISPPAMVRVPSLAPRSWTSLGLLTASRL